MELYTELVGSLAIIDLLRNFEIVLSSCPLQDPKGCPQISLASTIAIVWNYFCHGGRSMP
jgi:hypothetical protein